MCSSDLTSENKLTQAPTTLPSEAHSPVCPPNPHVPLHSFSLWPLTEEESLRELSTLDPPKSAGSDELDAFFVKTAAPIIAAPIADLSTSHSIRPKYQ